MEQRAGLDEVIARLYEAGAGSAGVSWTVALRGMQRAVKGHTVAVLALDVTRRSLVFHAVVGHAPPEALLDYMRSIHFIDPLLEQMLQRPVGHWLHCHEAFGVDFVEASTFYQEFLLPYGGRWASGIKLIEQGDTAVILVVTRRPDQGPLMGETFALCDRLAWHVAKAYSLNGIRVPTDDCHAAVSAMLHQLTAPVLLLDAECRIRFSNRSARALMSAGLALFEMNGRLALRFTEQDNALRALAASLYGLPEDDRFPASAYLPLAPTGHEGVIKPVRNRVMGVMLSSLLPERTNGAFGSGPVLLAVAHELHGVPELDPGVVASAFCITLAEAEVAIGLTSGLSVEQIAARRCKAVSTVRSQVKSMLAKMGCSRQVEVVSRVLSMPFIFQGMRCGGGRGRRLRRPE
ncbi:MAG: hypothetical protein Q8Q80_19085 [Methyloversatilis sp.]|uniref:hypothetical protein n=1 Tax=Methyloversatilis sp. TaxID=2569862 RepID=UPI00273393A5|nr:hypothetical protein [Methyloversatilis sp.]MDP3874771.1 hypothetical protein [Methyloversatilis sp.]